MPTLKKKYPTFAGTARYPLRSHRRRKPVKARGTFRTRWLRRYLPSLMLLVQVIQREQNLAQVSLMRGEQSLHLVRAQPSGIALAQQARHHALGQFGIGLRLPQRRQSQVVMGRDQQARSMPSALPLQPLARRKPPRGWARRHRDAGSGSPAWSKSERPRDLGAGGDGGTAIRGGFSGWKA